MKMQVIEPKLIRNAIRTPDGTVLESTHRHDYKTYTDKNGKTYMIDGGLDYVRCSNNGDEVFLTVTNKDPFILVREVFKRWNMFTGEWVSLSKMTNDWLENTIEFLMKFGSSPILYIQEKQYRMENEIFIAEENEEITIKANTLKERINERFKGEEGED